VFGEGHPLYGPNWIDRYLEAWESLGEPQKSLSEVDEPQSGRDQNIHVSLAEDERTDCTELQE